MASKGVIGVFSKTAVKNGIIRNSQFQWNFFNEHQSRYKEKLNPLNM